MGLNGGLTPRLTRLIHAQIATRGCCDGALLAIDEEDFLLVHPLGEIGRMVLPRLPAVDGHSGVGGFSIQSHSEWLVSFASATPIDRGTEVHWNRWLVFNLTNLGYKLLSVLLRPLEHHWTLVDDVKVVVSFVTAHNVEF